jgi:hypothetical protein
MRTKWKSVRGELDTSKEVRQVVCGQNGVKAASLECDIPWYLPRENAFMLMSRLMSRLTWIV